MKKYAWIMILTVLLVFGNIGMARAEIIPPQGPGQIGYQGAVLCQELTIRREPDFDSRSVGKLRYGDTFMVLKQSGGWAQVILSDDVDAEPAGWVNAEYIIIDPAWYRTDETTAVYAWDDTSAPKVALLDPGTKLPILKEEGKWVVVSLRGAAGWIRKTSRD